MSNTNSTLPVTTYNKPDNELFLAFVDAVGAPVADLKIKILSSGIPLELCTDDQGALPIINFGKEVGSATVSAMLPTGVEETVMRLQIGMGFQSFTCLSPYLLLKSQTRVHKGPPGAQEKPAVTAPGEKKEKRSKNGNPVSVCAVMDCPNDENLRLCPNQQYKSAILNASKRSGIIPQAIAALISAEAGRKVKKVEKPLLDKKGKPIIGKDGKPKVKSGTIRTLEWAEDSQNPRSTARGLTQFLEGTWLGQALDPTTYLHSEAVNRGYVKTESKKIVISKATKNKAAVIKEKSSYVIKQKDKLLAMRVEPEFAIMAAVDYGTQNLRGLKNAGFDASELDDSEKAKLFYLTHHLGLADAIRFIENKIEEEDTETTSKSGRVIRISGAQKLLSAQVGAESAEERATEEDGSYVLAHRRWLLKFIDENITPHNFACDKSKIPEGQKMFELISSIEGSHPEGFEVNAGK